MKTITILLAAAAITARSAMADDSWEIRELTRAVDANTTAINMQGSHSGWMYELMFGAQTRREEAQRQEMFARWQAETDAALAKQRAERDRNDKQDRALRAYLQSPPDKGHYNHPNNPGPEIRRAIPVAK